MAGNRFIEIIIYWVYAILFYQYKSNIIYIVILYYVVCTIVTEKAFVKNFRLIKIL